MREHIVSEIKRLAAENGGRAPGNAAFVSATGIKETKWRGKYWARWGDALIEAGLEPNTWTGKSDAAVLLAGLVTACRHYGKFPTNSEIGMLRQSDLSIPSPKVLQLNFDGRDGLVRALAEHIGGAPEYADIRAMLPQPTPSARAVSRSAKGADGSVYLIKSGEFFKIGRSDELERRVKEIRVALPDAATLLHTITTDDPPGIEAYWHRRFADRRANGEWFRLSPEDVKVFMRRKFQ
jgi:hypothetical protein